MSPADQPRIASALRPVYCPRARSAQCSDLINLGPSAVADRRVRRLKRSVWASGHLHGLAERGHRPAVAWFVTLTYADANGWAGDHVSKALQRYRGWCRTARVPCRYTWIAEMQPERARLRGEFAVHYHLLVWLPIGARMPHWDKSRGRRSAFWCHGWSNTEQARAGVGYLMKYLSKLGELTRFPKGLRLYGVGGLDESGKSVRQWFNLPQWAKNAYGVAELGRAAGRLVVRATGEILEPVFRVSRVPSGLILQKPREVAPRFPEHESVGAFSTWPRAS